MPERPADRDGLNSVPADDGGGESAAAARLRVPPYVPLARQASASASRPLELSPAAVLWQPDSEADELRGVSPRLSALADEPARSRSKAAGVRIAVAGLLVSAGTGSVLVALGGGGVNRSTLNPAVPVSAADGGGATVAAPPFSGSATLSRGATPSQGATSSGSRSRPPAGAASGALLPTSAPVSVSTPSAVISWDVAAGLPSSSPLVVLSGTPPVLVSSAPSAAATVDATVVAIAAGGGAVPPFVADEYYVGGSSSTYHGATMISSPANDTAPQALYTTYRLGNFQYVVPGLIPGRAYSVRLYFAETYWKAAGQRVFDVAVNGSRVLAGFDVVAAAGRPMAGVVRDVAATADSGGVVSLQFSTVVDNAMVNGIKLTPVG